MSSGTQPGLDDLSRGELLDRIEELETLVEWHSDAIENHNEKLRNHRDRIEELEWTREHLVRELPTSKKSKRAKIHAILRRAVTDAPENAARWSIQYPKASGAADCGDRHARNLFQDIDETYSFARYDPDGQPYARLVIEWGGTREAFHGWLDDQFPDCVPDER